MAVSYDYVIAVFIDFSFLLSMLLSRPNDISVYNLSGGKSLPEVSRIRLVFASLGCF